MLRKIFMVAVVVVPLQGCGTIQALNVLNDAKCKTQIAKKDSKFICEIEGRKLTGKK